MVSNALRVLMPRGQTIVHLPQSMHADIIGRTSCPRWSESSTLRIDIPVNGAAVQVAEHEPQLMHSLAVGSTSQSLSNSEQSMVSRLIVPLLLIENPKSIIAQVFVDG